MKKHHHMMRFMEADGGGNPTGGTAGAGDPPSLIATPQPAGAGDPPAPGTPPPAESPWIGADGAFSDKWTDKLPADLEGRESLGRFKTVADLAKSYRNMEALVGKKTLVPTDKSTPEEVAAYRKALGIPDKVEDYKIKPDTLPDGVGWNDENGRTFAKIALENNVPPAAMRAIVDEYGKMRIVEMQAMAEEIDARKVAGADSLRKTWGADFDKNLAVAQQAAKLAGVNADSFGFGDPEVVKGFVRLASQLSDDKLVAGGGTPQSGGKARAMDIMQNKTNPLFEKYQNGDPDTVEMVRAYLQQG